MNTSSHEERQQTTAAAAADKAHPEVQSVARAARVLLSFVDAPALGPTEVARRTGLHKSVAHRLLATLAGAGLLIRDPAGLYRLGPVMGRLQPHEGAHAALGRVGRPYLQRLCDASGETASLCVLDGTVGRCIDVAESPQAMRFTVQTGDTFPLNAGCIGKVMLAFQGEAFIDELVKKRALKRYTPNTITEPAALRAELARIRRVGHGFSDAEITPGSRSVGAPVFGADGRVLASLVISAPAFRMPEDALPRLIALVTGEAAALSGELGHRPLPAPSAPPPAPPGRSANTAPRTTRRKNPEDPDAVQ